MADYCVRINNIGDPAHKGISNKNIEEFGHLLKNGSSDFSKWFTKNKQNLYNTVKQTGESKIARNLNDYYSMDIFNKNSVMVGGSNLAVFGGILFLMAIVYYLFYRNKTKKNVLQKLNDVQHGGTATQIYGPAKYSHRYQFRSLVYKISKDSHDYALKISNSQNPESRENAYVSEYEIYKLLNKDPLLKKVILQCYGEESSRVSRTNPFNFNFTIDGNKELLHSAHPDSAMHTTIVNNTFICTDDEDGPTDCLISYIVLDYAEGYQSLISYTRPGGARGTIEPSLYNGILFENILRTIIYMHDKYNFVHYDLHGNNVLVNPRTLDFIIYDFDKSSTERRIANKYSLIRNDMWNLSRAFTNVNRHGQFKLDVLIKQFAGYTSAIYNIYMYMYLVELILTATNIKISSPKQMTNYVETIYPYIKSQLKCDPRHPDIINPLDNDVYGRVDPSRESEILYSNVEYIEAVSKIYWQIKKRIPKKKRAWEQDPEIPSEVIALQKIYGEYIDILAIHLRNYLEKSVPILPVPLAKLLA